MSLSRNTRARTSPATFLIAWLACLAMVVTLVGGAAPAAAAAAPGSDRTATAVGDRVKTADLSQFRAGNIVSDAVFFNSGTMGEAEIQAFLEARVPSCQSGYTCLKDKYDTSRTTSADAMCAAYSGGVTERASRIIYKVAQACGINPQVILVTLQKEQGLVTHTWPSDWRYTIAMGQGCPDTAACDERYHGFFNQVYGAAWQLKRYANPPGTSQYFTWYAPGNTWNIQWHPNQGCGSSPVYVENQATANLYYYTPYQPNAAALRAGYGEGDGCSSYGNRNFFQYFVDWFGSTQQGAVASAPPTLSLDDSQHIVSVDSAGSVWAYPFRNGQWGDAVSLVTGSPLTQLVAMGDLDGDGHRDIVGVDASSVGWLYRGDGEGYSTGTQLAVDWTTARLITAAGDFDSDGVPDVFTIDGSGVLWLWAGNGYGGFRAAQTAGSGWGGMNLVTGGDDVTGDGNADLVARDAAGGLYVYGGDGRGSWSSGAQVGQGWGAMTALISAGDFDGSAAGRADLLARDGGGDLYLYRGAGGGGFSSGIKIGHGWQTMSSIAGPGMETGSARPLAPGAGDMSGDGAPDVLAAAGNELRVYEGNGSGSWKDSTVLDSAWPADARFVTLGDFTGDGHRDVGRIGADGTFTLLPGTGASALSDGIAIGSGWGGLDVVVGGIDFDGDRKSDVIARDTTGRLLLYRGDGAGGWLSGGEAIGNGWSGFDIIVNAGDFDGDGHADVMTRTSGGDLWLYPTNGRGSWLTARQIGNGWGGFTALVAPGNFDGAGGPDILARTAGGDLFIYRGDGSGSWSGSATVGSGWAGFTQIG